MLDIRITLALSFSLAIMAGLMVVALAIASGAAKRPVLEPKQTRGFKGDALSTSVRLSSMRIRWISMRASSVVTGRGGSMAMVENDVIRIPLATTAAGRFTGMRLRLEFSDPLRLFSKVHDVVFADFTLDVLPLSLTRPPSARRVALLTSGEVPAGSPGMGQELFGVDEYRPSTDIRNIIWKRTARSADQNLFTRIRESNVPSTIRIGLLEMAQRGEERIAWMDLLCEGAGLLGKELIDLGSTVEFLYGSPQGLVVQRASNQQELADALMQFSESIRGARFTAQVIGESDAVVTGMREVERPEIARSLFRKPSLLIYERGSTLSLGDRSLVFSGSESIFPLLARMVEK